MSYIPIEDIVEIVGSKYKLVNLASKRVAELHAGCPRLIETAFGNAGTTALEEIRQGRVKLKRDEG